MSCFVTFARAHGLEIDPSKLHPSERIRRCGTVQKPRGTNGAYFWDGGRGWVYAWDGEARVQWWNDPTSKPWSEADRAQWRAKRDAARVAQQAQWRAAAHSAALQLRRAKPAPHAYLHRKGFPEAQAMVSPEGAMLVPMRSLAGDLQSLQTICWDEGERAFTKKMLYGGRAKGAVFRFGDRAARELVLCEGYADGLSIATALRTAGLPAAALVCFNAGNLEHVASALPAGRAMVFADNDASGAGERAAQATGLPYCMSDVVGEDPNDLYRRCGAMAITALVMQTRRRA